MTRKQQLAVADYARERLSRFPGVDVTCTASRNGTLWVSVDHPGETGRQVRANITTKRHVDGLVSDLTDLEDS